MTDKVNDGASLPRWRLFTPTLKKLGLKVGYYDKKSDLLKQEQFSSKPFSSNTTKFNQKYDIQKKKKIVDIHLIISQGYETVSQRSLGARPTESGLPNRAAARRTNSSCRAGSPQCTGCTKEGPQCSKSKKNLAPLRRSCSMRTFWTRLIRNADF